MVIFDFKVEKDPIVTFQSIYRGFITRLRLCRAVVNLQKLWRGHKARLQLEKLRWERDNIFISQRALQVIINQSKLLRENNSKVDAEHWFEYYHQLTDVFWYNNPYIRCSTYNCPLVFQKSLVCSWQGYKEYGGLPSQNVCRQIFHSMSDYNYHRKYYHKWFCVM